MTHKCKILSTTKSVTIENFGDNVWNWIRWRKGIGNADRILYCPYCGGKLESDSKKED